MILPDPRIALTLFKGPSRKADRRASMLFPTSLTSSTTTQAAPRSSDSATFKDSFTPTTSTANYPFDSPSNHLTANAGTLGNGQKPSLTRLLSGSSIKNATTSPPAHITTTPNLNPPLALNAPSGSAPAETTPGLAPGPVSGGPSPTPSQVANASGPSDSDKSKAKDAAHSAAKSFRVTLEDPCWKVLPAALKKYKINDDWKMYALFICFGNTGERKRFMNFMTEADMSERCLSYDEKPLMLFQKLKESGQKPVFMLRHIVRTICYHVPAAPSTDHSARHQIAHHGRSTETAHEARLTSHIDRKCSAQDQGCFRDVHLTDQSRHPPTPCAWTRWTRRERIPGNTESRPERGWHQGRDGN